jgi:hypothetical protein
VKTAFPLGQRRGVVFTSGRHGQDKPELFLENVPVEARETVVDILEHAAGIDLKAGDSVAEDGGVFVVAQLTREAAREMVRTSLRALPKRARLLELRPAARQSCFGNPRAVAEFATLAADMRAQPCTGCGGLCDCGGDRFLSATYRGESVYMGCVATERGMMKEHADGTRHKMSSIEWHFDDALYEPVGPVPGELFLRVARRGTPELERTLPAVKNILQRMEEDTGATTTLLPEEVRTGDLVLRTGALCNDPACSKCHQMLDVLAVHHDGRGLVVDGDGVPAPFRIQLNTIAGSVHGPHWGEDDDGDDDDDEAEEEEEEDDSEGSSVVIATMRAAQRADDDDEGEDGGDGEEMSE